MSISKSLRFAVLQRDGFTCRYCGAGTGDGAQLTVDHIIPKAHGGTDDATNLVAACFDCNAGKAAIPAGVRAAAPDRQAIEQLREQVSAFREKLELQAQFRDLEIAREQLHHEDLKLITEIWDATFHDYVALPSKQSLMQFLEGIGYNAILQNMEIARAKVGRGVGGAKYFYGCCYRQLRERQEADHFGADEITSTSDPNG